jgi:serine/threonine protein kinase/tetratricopeptide (TPR) repeat protein
MNEKMLVNRYKVLEKLGEGGMAIVWRVYDEVTKKEVALKEIKRKPEEEQLETGSRMGITPTKTRTTEAELRFSEEFRTMTKLQYPYTVKVFDYGIVENGNKYITMEIVEGENLKEILKKRKLDFEEIYKVLIQLSQALNFIHSRLYVHRDIKSENIMITKGGNVKLMDFGLMDRLGITSDGTITGTVQYIPPEVLKGGVINESSDLYSLGILAYELTTGRLPFHGEKVMDIVRMHMNTPPKPLMENRPDTPPELGKIIFKLLEKEQNNRFQTASEVIEELSKLSEEEITFETLEQKKSYLYCHELIGREKEINKLRDAFEKIKKGEGQSIFIAAPAGVGKSRLIEEFKLEVQLSEIPFFEGFCNEQGMSIFQPLREAFKPVLLMTRKETIDKYGSVLVKILPELRTKGYEPTPPLEEMAEKVRLLENVTGWLKDVSKDQSLVICIEDLHWSDATSIDLFNACIRGLTDSLVMFIGVFRDDEVGEASPIFHTIEEGLTQSIKLSSLNQDNVCSLIETMLGKIELTEEFTEQIFSVTGGNPFFVTEMMRSLIEEEQIKLEYGKWKLPEDLGRLELPTSIEATITRRLKLLSQEAFNLIQIASVIGRELDLSILKEISNFEENKLFEVLDELVEGQDIKKEKEKYIFTHDRVRETLYSQLDEGKKRELHEKAGNTLEERNINNIQAVVHLLAYHFSRGTDKQKAVKYLIMAGDDSEQKAAYVDFVEKYRKALSILEVIDYPGKEKVLFEARSKFIIIGWFEVKYAIETYQKILLDIYNLAGGEEKLKKAAKMFQRVYKMINLLPSKVAGKIKDKLSKKYPPYDMPKRKDYAHIISTLVELSVFTGIALYTKGEFEQCISMVDTIAEGFLPETTGSLAYACILPARAGAFTGSERYTRAVQEMKESLSILEEYFSRLNRLQLIILTAAWFWHNNAQMLLGTLKDEYVKRHFEIAEKNYIFDQIGWCYFNQFCALALKGKHPEAEIIEEKWSDQCKKLGYPKVMEAWRNIWGAYHYLWRGEFDKVERFLSKAKRMKLSDTGQEFSYVKVISGLFYIEQGKLEEGIPLLEDCVSFCSKYNLDRLIEAKANLSEVYIQIGKLKEAAILLEEGRQRATSKEYWNPMDQITIYRVLGKLNLKEKNFEQAKKYLEESIQIAQQLDNPIREGLSQLALAELFIELTQYTQAEESLEKAARKFKEIENEFQLKKVQAVQKKLKELIS